MKNAAAVLLLILLSVVTVQAEAIGDITNVNGTIQDVSFEHYTLTIGGTVYKVDVSTLVTLDGTSANITDLAVGMSARGSAEVKNLRTNKTLRMLTATSAPAPTATPAQAASTPAPAAAAAPAQTAAPAQAAAPAQPAATPGQTAVAPGQMTAPPPWVAAAMGADLEKNLIGTYWSMQTAGGGNSTPPNDQTPWFCLTGKHSLTCSWSKSEGRWGAAPRGSMFSVTFPESTPFTIMLDPDHAKGSVYNSIPGVDPRTPAGQTNLVATVTRLDSPTQAMRDAVASITHEPQQSGQTPSSSSASATSAPTPDMQATASEIVKTQHGNLVFVTGAEGAGSGFIANMDGATYLVTNAHVAAGINGAEFKTLDDTVIKTGAPSAAVGEDIFRMTTPAGDGKPLEIMQNVEANASIGDAVVVLGNAEGSGVINTIMGKIVGFGPKLVEIDAQFVPGNSGSPIVHLKSGKVIGVATYLVTKKYDAATGEKLKDPVIRRFGYRLDSVKTWQPVSWPMFYMQAATMQKIHTLTEDLYDFFRDIHDNKGRVTIERHTNPAIKDPIARWIEAKSGRHSAYDSLNADENFLSFLKVACQSDITSAQRSFTYDYFQRDLADEQQSRTEMSKAFAEIIQDIQQR